MSDKAIPTIGTAEQPKCFKNQKNPSCINLILMNKPQSLSQYMCY